MPVTVPGYTWFSSTLKRQWDLFSAELKAVKNQVHGYPLHCYTKSEKRKKQRGKKPHQTFWHKTFCRRIYTSAPFSGWCLPCHVRLPILYSFYSLCHDVRERAPPFLPHNLYVPEHLGAAGSVISCAQGGGSYSCL